MKILNLTCSSSGCERNWSTFEQIHTKRRNKLLHDRMRDLVFVKFNSKLRQKRENMSKDPLEKEIDDVLADTSNEFVTGEVPAEKEDCESVQDAVAPELQEASMAQPQSKRKRPLRPRKKKLRSIQSLMLDTEQPEASSSSSESKTDHDDNGSLPNSDSAEDD